MPDFPLLWLNLKSHKLQADLRVLADKLDYIAAKYLTCHIGVARGYTCTPRAVIKILGAKFTGESCKCTPSQSKSLIFGGDLESGKG